MRSTGNTGHLGAVVRRERQVVPFPAGMADGCDVDNVVTVSSWKLVARGRTRERSRDRVLAEGGRSIWTILFVTEEVVDVEAPSLNQETIIAAAAGERGPLYLYYTIEGREPGVGCVLGIPDGWENPIRVRIRRGCPLHVGVAAAA